MVPLNIVSSIIALTLAVKLSDALGGWKVLLASYGWITLALAVVWIIFFQDFERDPKLSNNADAKKEELRIALTSRITWGMIVQLIMLLQRAKLALWMPHLCRCG
ncbi:hypothetical protein [Vibrio owensii]|uniref:MFS transporter n=1 Tax=Vibrio owensii CAIM 1854 = LMG 25443 TaxID=1229493 RepID=A0A0C1VL11_9VIBR|nr:hypothetical protein [Vibrio owensii]KIF44892.1 hypothetical protein H735_30110 [Vibrio owensii CAIM 1854 = LMG 25443]